MEYNLDPLTITAKRSPVFDCWFKKLVRNLGRVPLSLQANIVTKSYIFALTDFFNKNTHR